MQRGLPRPKTELKGREYPHPYTAHSKNPGWIDETRADECRYDVLCGVCGLGIEGNHVYVISSGTYDSVMGHRSREAVVDKLAFDERCAKMTMRWCPAIKDPEARSKVRRITKAWYKKRYGLSAWG